MTGVANYYAMRPTLAIRPGQVLDLDGFFGLHPALAPFLPLYRDRHLAIVHASGLTDATRSHFDAQDFTESGTLGLKTTPDGWLNRALQAGASGNTSPFCAIALGGQVPRTLQGRVSAVAVRNLQDFAVGERGSSPSPMNPSFEQMYADSLNAVLHGAGQETFDAVKMLKATSPEKYKPEHGAQYPAASFGNSMKQIAQLLKANLGVEAAFADIGDWDTHQNQGNINDRLVNRQGLPTSN